MTEKLSAVQIFEICVALAKRLKELNISRFSAVEEAIKNPDLGANLLAVIENTGNPPTVCVQEFGTLKPLKDDEILDGGDFVKRSGALIRNMGNKALGAEHYASLKKAENQHLLPISGDSVVVFLGTQFQIGDRTYIRALRRDEETSDLVEESLDLTSEFDKRFEVAVSSSSSLTVVG